MSRSAKSKSNPKVRKEVKTQRKKTRAKTTPTLVHLSSAEMKQMPKPRAGWQGYVPDVMAMYSANEERLSIDGVDPDATLAELREYEALVPMFEAVQKQYALLQETMLYHASRIWTVTLKVYDRAQPLGRTDENIARAISDFAEFMKNGPRKKKGAPGNGGNGAPTS